MTPHKPIVAPAGRFSLLLDVCRALAALAVVLGHARSLFIVDFPSVESPTVVDQAVYFAAFGHQAVIVFFVLSGWLVGGKVLAQRWRGTFATGPYALQRATRMWVVLVPAMLLGLLAHGLYAGLGVDPVAPGELGAAVGATAFPQTVEALFGPATFLGNLLGLNTVLVPNYGGNEVLWSLSHEIIFYALVPLWAAAAINLVRGPRRLARSLLCLAVVGGAVVLLPPYHRLTLVLWSLGAVAGAWLALSPIARRPGPWLKLAAWTAFAAALVATRVGLASPEIGDLAIALTFLLCLAIHRLGASAPAGEPAREGTLARCIRWLSGISFSLYVLHPLVLIALGTALLDGARLAPGARGYGFIALAVAASIVAAWLFSLVTEAQTDRVRRWASRQTARVWTARRAHRPAPDG